MAQSWKRGRKQGGWQFLTSPDHLAQWLQRLRFGSSAWLLQGLGVRIIMSYVVWPLSVCIFSFTTGTGKYPGLSSQLQMAPKHIGVMKTMFLNDQTRNGLKALNLWEWSQHLTSPTERRWTLEPNFFKSFWNFFSCEREKQVSVEV